MKHKKLSTFLVFLAFVVFYSPLALVVINSGHIHLSQEAVRSRNLAIILFAVYIAVCIICAVVRRSRKKQQNQPVSASKIRKILRILIIIFFHLGFWILIHWAAKDFAVYLITDLVSHPFPSPPIDEPIW